MFAIWWLAVIFLIVIILIALGAFALWIWKLFKLNDEIGPLIAKLKKLKVNKDELVHQYASISGSVLEQTKAHAEIWEQIDKNIEEQTMIGIKIGEIKKKHRF